MSGVTVKAKIVGVGNSRGIRIPKALLAGSKIGDEVELIPGDGQMLVRTVSAARSGWAEAFAAMHAAGDDGLLGLETVPGRFDENDWTW